MSKMKELLTDAPCISCGDLFDVGRAELGYVICKQCGDARATQERTTWCVVPMNKSNYMLVTDIEVLRQLNPKRTT